MNLRQMKQFENMKYEFKYRHVPTHIYNEFIKVRFINCTYRIYHSTIIISDSNPRLSFSSCYMMWTYTDGIIARKAFNRKTTYDNFLIYLFTVSIRHLCPITYINDNLITVENLQNK